MFDQWKVREALTLVRLASRGANRPSNTSILQHRNGSKISKTKKKANGNKALHVAKEASSSPDTLPLESPPSSPGTVLATETPASSVDTLPGIESQIVRPSHPVAQLSENAIGATDSNTTISNPGHHPIPESAEPQPFGAPRTGLISVLSGQYPHDSLVYNLVTVAIEQSDLNDMGKINGSDGCLSDSCMRFVLASQADLTGSFGVGLLDPGLFNAFDRDNGVDTSGENHIPSFFFPPRSSNVPITALAIPWQHSNHWMAILVDLQHNVAVLCDSLRSDETLERATLLLGKFFQIHRMYFRAQRDIVVKRAKSAQQEDSITCGFYAARNLSQMTRRRFKVALDPFPTGEIARFRSVWVEEMRRRMVERQLWW